MKLSKFLENTGMPVLELARRAKVSRSTLDNLMKRRRRISLTVAVKISEATTYKVSPEEIYEEYIE
jgi:plasmid maintenance system antidote protein VapI